MQLRMYLEQSALLLEGVEKLNQTSVINCYSGFNVTKTDKEPIDQIQAFIAARQIQDYNLATFGQKGQFISFIGGLFEVLNCKNLEELEELVKINLPKEQSKKRLYQKIYKAFGIEGKILTTEDLWQDPQYWEILKGLFDTKVFVRGDLINDALAFYENIDQLMAALRVKQLPSSLVNLPLEFIKKIGNFPAPILYTPAEVTEAFYLQQKYGVAMKLGQAQERTYDKYMYGDFSVFRLRQPVSLTSTLDKPEVVTPYIDKSTFEQSGIKKKGLRLYFADTKAQITEKILQTPVETYVFTSDDIYGEVLNPLVEKAVFVVESARAMQKTPLKLAGATLNCGQDVINTILDGKLSILDLQESLPEAVYKYLIKPIGAKL